MYIRIYIVIECFDVGYYKSLVEHPKRGHANEVKPYRILGTFTSKKEAQKRYDALMSDNSKHNGAPWFYTIEKI